MVSRLPPQGILPRPPSFALDRPFSMLPTSSCVTGQPVEQYCPIRRGVTADAHLAGQAATPRIRRAYQKSGSSASPWPPRRLAGVVGGATYATNYAKRAQGLRLRDFSDRLSASSRRPTRLLHFAFSAPWLGPRQLVRRGARPHGMGSGTVLALSTGQDHIGSIKGAQKTSGSNSQAARRWA